MEFYVRNDDDYKARKTHVALTDDSARKVLLTFAGTYATYFGLKYALLYSIRRFSTN